MGRRAILFTFILALCVSSYIAAASLTQASGGASTGDVNAIKSDADKAYIAQDWKSAAELYGQLTKTEPQSGFAWFRLGNALRRRQQYPEALAALEKAKALGFQPPVTQAMIAGVYSASGETEKALAIIEQVAQSAVLPNLFEQDAAFEKLRSNPRYQAAITQMRVNAAPCKFPDKNPEYRQFDFWLGEWDVYGQGGAKAGTSKIDLILGDCVVLENWTGGAGGEGKSFNKYSPEFKRWEQYWVDAQGSTTFFHGKLEGKNMVYHAETPQPDGSILKRRLTFFNLGPDKVRQFSQQTKDDGKSWQTEYDLFYIRKNSQAKL
jgi:tetratricopeptide (TPR) repeat protein